MNIVEYIRKRVTKALFETKFSTAFGVWKDYMNSYFDQTPTSFEILNFGDELSEMFRTTTKKGRGQGTVANAGNAWEMLICWYLNLCSIGSRMVVIKKISDLPNPLRDAISVNYGNIKCNTESDLIVVVFPNEEIVKQDIEDIQLKNSRGETINNFTRGGNFNYEEIGDKIVQKHFDKFEVGIIQCKTNWNDNAQIPMLWNMVYQSEDFKDNQITIGRNNYTIKHLNKFTYSFITVPTVKLENFSATSVAVQRVRNLSGGNYWGHPSKSGIARNVKEIINNNFTSAFDTNQRKVLEETIPYLNQELSYFKI